MIEHSNQKDNYIRELEKQKELGDSSGVVEEMERKCRELYEEREGLMGEYQGKIGKLERELERVRELSKEKVERSAADISSSKSFDQVMKIQIT